MTPTNAHLIALRVKDLLVRALEDTSLTEVQTALDLLETHILQRDHRGRISNHPWRDLLVGETFSATGTSLKTLKASARRFAKVLDRTFIIDPETLTVTRIA